MFSKEVLDVLHSAGWYEGRRVQDNTFLPTLRDLGLQPEGASLCFLREFHDLELEFPDRCQFGFSVKHSAELFERSHYSHLRNHVRKPICLIGRGWEGILFMSPDGSVIYCDIGWALLAFFESYQDMIESGAHRREDLRRVVYMEESDLPVDMQGDD